MNITFDKLKELAMKEVNEWFLNSFIKQISTLNSDDFKSGGYIFFALESEYNQYPVIVSDTNRSISISVFVGSSIAIYRQEFNNLEDMSKKIVNYYYLLLCNDNILNDFINDDLKEVESIEELEDSLFMHIIGDWKTFAIEFEGWNLLPIGR